MTVYTVQEKVRRCRQVKALSIKHADLERPWELLRFRGTGDGERLLGERLQSGAQFFTQSLHRFIFCILNIPAPMLDRPAASSAMQGKKSFWQFAHLLFLSLSLTGLRLCLLCEEARLSLLLSFFSEAFCFSCSTFSASLFACAPNALVLADE